MSTAEQLAFSISSERRAVHVLLWDDKNDLVRALLALLAGLDIEIYSLVVSDRDEDLSALRRLVETRIPISEDEMDSDHASEGIAARYWLLFLQQASSTIVGPWLNGWRRPISETPGSMLVIRHADYDSFQRSAPDIASFVGPRIFDASTMLSVFSKTTYDRLSERLPEDLEQLLGRLPGTAPSEKHLMEWIQANGPDQG
jgi:hypothetical protein